MNFSLKSNWIIICGCIFALLAVVIGAFSAHALKGSLDVAGLKLMETGARYQMYHAFALLFCGLLAQFIPSGQAWVKKAVISFIIGIVLFSGALYMIALTGFKSFGMIAPLGGIAFIIGWLILIVATIRGSKV